MKRLTISWIAFACLLVIGAYAEAGGDPQANDKKELTAQIQEITGTVEVKEPGGQDWAAATKGMKLKKESEICTGYGSGCVLVFQEEKTSIKIEIASLTQVKVDETLRQQGKVDTNIDIKFGTIEFDVKKGQLEVDMKVSTPNSTTSIRGTNGRVTHFSDFNDRAPMIFSTVRIENGSVTVEDTEGSVTQTVDAGTALISPEFTPMDCMVYLETVTMPYYGAPLQETTTYTENVVYDTSTSGFLPSNFTPDSNVIYDRVVQQQSSLLPGPPPPPGQ